MGTAMTAPPAQAPSIVSPAPSRTLSSPESPYYLHLVLVPKGLNANLEWRRKTLREAAKDPDFAAELWKMCARDVLFYINGFVWTHDPRVSPSVLPFITFDFQDEALLEMQRALG